MKYLLTCCSLFLFCFTHAQKIDTLTGGTDVSLRGLSVVNDSVIWASGSGGSVARSADGGKTFAWQTVTGYEQRDFRDIEAFDANTAIIMAIAEPAVILKTADAGKTWHKVFEDSTKGMFLDAMDFSGKWGVVVGDPLNHAMFLATTSDSGNHWTAVSSGVPLVQGEAFFASSGTNVKLLSGSDNGRYDYVAASGGTEANFIAGNKYKLAMLQGKESQGANSVAVYNKKIVVVGGDFANKVASEGNCLLSGDGGKTWKKPNRPPQGYKSCVVFLSPQQLLACGTSGVDISNDGGKHWLHISNESFHACSKAKEGNAVFLAGVRGRIAKLSY